MPQSISPLPEPKPLLPNEPRVPNWQAEDALTQRFLIPALPRIEALFWHLRERLEPGLREAQPVKNGKPFPLGQCLEISLAMERLLKQLSPSELSGPAAEGYAALLAFQQHGGTIRQVWGDLRGEYFQNAFVVGTLYLDVSNDTVVPTKPKVEILPFEQARFSAVRDFVHFSQLAGRYWKAQVFPNHLVPALAPYFPVIVAIPAAGVVFEACSDYMMALTQTDGFRPSEVVLAAPPMDGGLHALLAATLAGSTLACADNPAQGRALALEHCARYRAAGLHASSAQREQAIKGALVGNERLRRLKVDFAAN